MFGTMNPNDLGAAFQQLGQMLSYEGGPVNWDMAKQIARQTVSQGTPDGTKDASVGPSERSAVDEALRLADLWLDGVTSLPSGSVSTVAWSRAEWVEASLPAWQKLVDPVAERVGLAMGDVLPEEMQAMAGPLIGMMRSMGGAMFGQQIGQAVGVLAGEVVGSTDIGLPLGPAGKAALLPLNVERFGKDLSVPQDEVRLYLALREAAHQRLFAHVPWLRSHLFGAVEGYARGIKVDTSKLEDVVGQFDPSQPEQLQDALQQGMFQPEDTPEQKAALARLETALALVEGWVDAVVHEAAKSRLTSADALRETMRRRRASGGPAEQTFATLIGLQLRPRRCVTPRVCGPRSPTRAVWTGATPCGSTPTCCPRPRTWTIRTASCTTSSWTSPSWTRCSARPRRARRSPPRTRTTRARPAARRPRTARTTARATATGEPARRRRSRP